MKNVLVSCALASMVVCGCEKSFRTEVGEQVSEVRRLIQTLQTNTSERAVFESFVILTNLQRVASCDERRSLVFDWVDALLHLPIESLPLKKQVTTMGVALRFLNVDAYWMMRDMGAGCQELWDHRFRTLDWLDGHIARMNPELGQVSDNENVERQKWMNYLAMVERREACVEGWECTAFDLAVCKSESDELEEIKRRFEEKIGRNVRQSDQIKTSGLFAKEAAVRIREKERLALEKMRRKKERISH